MSSLHAYLFPLAVLAAVGSGLVAGLLFAFSTAVMRALQRLPPEQGMRAMQHINVVILNRTFLGIFNGTTLLSAVLAVSALFGGNGPAGLWMLAGAAAYIVGTFGVTMVVNVPLNNRLAATDASAPEAAATWASYVDKWLRWNHLRTLMGASAMLSFTLSAVHLRGAVA
jgi:uncharacterized membrane protein